MVLIFRLRDILASSRELDGDDQGFSLNMVCLFMWKTPAPIGLIVVYFSRALRMFSVVAKRIAINLEDIWLHITFWNPRAQMPGEELILCLDPLPYPAWTLSVIRHFYHLTAPVFSDNWNCWIFNNTFYPFLKNSL